MNSGNNQGKKSRPPFFRKKGQPVVPWPNDLRLRLMGKTGIGAGVFILLLFTIFFLPEVEHPSDPLELADLLVLISLFVFGILYIAAGILAIQSSSKKTQGWRKALRAVCIAMILCGVVVCVLLYQEKKDYVACGTFGFIWSFPLLTLEKGMK